MTDGTALDKTFDPAAIEAKWYAHWEGNGLFRPDRPEAVPYTIVNPPPNVTGSLHIGHALDNTLQDIMIRYERLRGKDALWVVGTDHAGIATQMVVERQLEAKQDNRTNYTREDFVAKVWEWKHESGGTITQQLRRLGCSMDWSREQFTMDPHFTRAVVKVFVDLYNKALIYRDKRLVNWDPKLKTAISDLEVETREIKGHFWHFRYPLADGVKLANGADHIVVATTRPETMLADMCVAVNADDPRYQSVIGKEILQPLTGRRLRILADEHADPELGSGAVKITPGHDFNDFDVGKRAGIKPADMLNMFDAEANVVQPIHYFVKRLLRSEHGEDPETVRGSIPTRFLGLHRFRRDGVDGAREAVVTEMKELGFLVPHIDRDGNEHEAEPRTIQTPFGDRGGVVIEPWLTDQWYVNAAELAKAPLEAVRSGAVEIVPKSWEKTFFNWMENIQPWCVSRQLWWGHRIPAWYGPEIHPGGIPGQTAKVEQGQFILSNDKVYVSESTSNALFAASEYVAQSTLNDGHKVSRTNIGKVSVLIETDRPGPHGKLVAYRVWDESIGHEFPENSEFNVRDYKITQDNDVLDTWFSSALWPFATLGWPEENPPRNGEVAARSADGGVEASPDGAALAESNRPLRPSGAPPRSGEDLLARHYPNNLLISGFDILFFWDARMLMLGQAMTGQNPWPRLYLHGLVRAPDGQKMSKSKGNVIDPLLLIDQFGADALRFFMAAMESQGRDIKMDERRVEGYRNFATKLWNAARFCQSNGIGASSTLAAPAATSAINKWIIGEVVETLAALDQALADLRFDAAANAIYHFVWDQFCDWYIELIKGSFDAETKAVAGWVLDQILVMLHPFMPFVTEELWSALGDRADYPLITAKWPEPGMGVDAAAKAEVSWLIARVVDIRSAKNELGIAPGAKLEVFAPDQGEPVLGLIGRNESMLNRLARISSFHFAPPPLGSAMQISAGGTSNWFIPLEGVIDIAAEKARLTKALEVSAKEAKSLEGRLSNPSFVEKAKPEAVEKARADHALHAAEAERLAAALARLG